MEVFENQLPDLRAEPTEGWINDRYRVLSREDRGKRARYYPQQRI